MSVLRKAIFIFLLVFPAYAFAQSSVVIPNDDAIKQAIKAQCEKYYLKRGGSCLCYEECRRNSVYAKRQRSGVPVPFCNQSDVSESDVKQFRAQETRMIKERCDTKLPPRP